MLNIAVIVKRIEASGSRPSEKLLDIADKKAIDIATEIKEKLEANVCVFCIAPYESAEVIRECYAFGVDAGYLLDDPSFERVDESGIVSIFGSAIKRVNDFDLIFIASTSDKDAILDVGKKMANFLGTDHIGSIENIKMLGSRLFAVPCQQDKKEKELQSPTLINFVFDPSEKIHNAMRIMKVFKKDVKFFNSSDLGINIRKFSK